MSSPSASESADVSNPRSGILIGLSAHALWGFLPLYFLLLAPTGPIEIVACRILFSLLFCAVIIGARRRFRDLLAIVRQPRLAGILGLAAALIFINWQVYVFASVTGHILEASLGYFMNPIVTILLGVIVLRERLHPVQWVAVAISLVAVVVLAINYGSVPWISLTLAFSFGLYGFVKNRVGGSVDAMSGLTIETAWLVPVAAVALVFVNLNGGLTIGAISPLHTLGLVGTGVVTAVPLLLFALAARKLPLVYLGFIQYLTPILQFLLGAFVLHEAMPPTRWFGFALVWVALLILSLHLIQSRRARRRRIPVLP